MQRLPENLLLFRHDPAAEPVLQLINSVTDVTANSLVEIVISGEWRAPPPAALVPAAGGARVQ